MSIVIIGLFFSDDAKAGTSELGDVSPPLSSSTARVTEALTLTHHAYLPFVYGNSPLIVQVPEGEYLLVEHWTHHVLGVNCAGLCIDFPTYDFDPQSGKLTIYAAHPPEPALVLDDDDVGYIGRGTSMGGVGCGASSGLTKVEQLPLSEDDLTLHYVDEAGSVTLEHKGEALALGPDEVWASAEEIESWDWLGAGCVVTSTHYITNYAFQDRDEITFSSQ